MLNEKLDKRAPLIEFLRQPSNDKVKSRTVTQDALAMNNDDISSGTSSQSVESSIMNNKIQEITTKPKQNNLAIQFNLFKPVTEGIIDNSVKNASSVIKTVIKAEKYNSNFWNKLVNKAPLNLRTEKEMYGKGSIRNNYINVINAPFEKTEKDGTRAVPVQPPSRSIHVNAGTTVEKRPKKVSIFYY